MLGRTILMVSLVIGTLAVPTSMADPTDANLSIDLARAEPPTHASGDDPDATVLTGEIVILEIGTDDCPTLDTRGILPVDDSETITSTVSRIGGGYATSTDEPDTTHRYSGLSVSQGDLTATCGTFFGLTFLQIHIRDGAFVAIG